MESLQFNSTSWHARLYESSYGNGLPKNICGYFWKLVFAMIMFIPCWVGHLFNKFDTNNACKAIWSFWHIPVFVFFASFLKDTGLYDNVETISFFKPLNLIKIYVIGLIVSALVIIILVCLLFLINFVCDWFSDFRYEQGKKRRNKKYNKTETLREIKQNPLKEGWKAFMGKYCKPINWN